MTTADRAVTEAIREVAHAITADAMPGHDAMGGHIASLTEAVMGATAALHAGLGDVATWLHAIAAAIEALAYESRLASTE